MAARFEDQVTYAGPVIFTQTPAFPGGGFVDNSLVKAGAAIAQDKLQHQHRALLDGSGTAVSETRPLARIYGATATLLDFKVGSIGVCAGAATITVDLKKNGTTVLTGIVTLNNANTARVAVNGAINTAGAVAGDLYEVVVVATAGGGTIGTGLFAELRWKEDAA